MRTLEKQRFLRSVDSRGRGESESERDRERQREGFVLCQIDSEASLMSNNTVERGEEELEYCFHFLFGANLSPFYFG